MKDFLKVGVSGVRGVVGDSLTPQIAAAFARAFAASVGQGSVVVGRDTRPSGYALERAVTVGLQSAGCKPLLAGIVPTPTVCLVVPELGARGGIAITASHNAARWNALKFIGPDGLFLPKQQADELADIYHQGNFPLVTEENMPSAVTLDNPLATHFRRILGYVDAAAIRRRHFKVAVDCCNGVGALHTRRFLEAELGASVVTCFDQPSGAFEREPEPLPQNLTRLSALVREQSCDIGFAQDPDGDRLAIVDEQGRPIGEDLTVAFAVRQVLDRHQRGPVAIHLATSRSVQCVAEDRGSQVTRTRIGEINVVQAMQSIGAVVGGEGNGGVIIPAIHPCRDSYAAMAVVLELMVAEKKTVSELYAEVPRYYMAKDKLKAQGESISRVLRQLRQRHQHQRLTLFDGVHVELDDQWFHARASNTEPVIRLCAEARTADEAEQLCRALRAELENDLANPHTP